MSTFNDFTLIPSLQETLREKGFITPTEIQNLTLPELLNGHSVVGLAETGTGKTLAYVLPILHMLKTLENEGQPVKTQSQPRAIVIVPTRELGEQVSKVFKIFTHETRLRIRSALGGTTMEMAKRNVAGCFEVLVATPKRTLQLFEHGLSLYDVRLIVFDEADQMLDPGFLPTANRLVKACPPNPQMVLFSATIAPVVQELMSKLFSKVKVFKSKGSHRVVPTLTTRNELIIRGDRFPVICDLLKEDVKGGILIFTNTRKQCDKLATQLKENNFKCAIFRGEMDRLERRANLKKFRDGQIDILISTDLASRGLDFDDVGRVINYHLPQEMENYLHRVGRTARAGRSGLVINFVTERDKELVDKLDSLQTSF
jgi:ATP-dependent RNA helicase RhlE